MMLFFKRSNFFYRFSGLTELIKLISFVLLISFVCVSCSTKIDESEPKVKSLKIEEPLPVPDAHSDFSLGPGDEIIISVWRNSELDRTVIIDPSGRMSMPLAGEFQVSGLTVSQLNKKITQRLAKYITNPYVDINIRSISSRKIHIMGEVKTPGTYAYSARIPIWEAISKAGGFTDDANNKRFLLIRVKNEEEALISVLGMDFEQMFEKGVLQAGYYLQNGDILYVPELKIASFEKFMNRLNNIIAPIYVIQRMITLYPSIVEALEGADNRNIIVP
ncbi:MAG: polysaccharide biosynthesis/export family protein [Desulfobacteraceae bacterium]|jgi:polysaccharide export outer membrane protein